MWNWLDTIVVFSAIAGYIVMLVQVITKTGGSSGVQSVSGLCCMLHCLMSLYPDIFLYFKFAVIRFLRILRLTRLLRPLKTVKMVPAIRVFVEAFARSIESFFLNLMVLFISLMAIAYILNAALDDSLQYRCVPTDFTNANVSGNAYYDAYGVDYFYSSYNNEYCSQSAESVSVVTCDTGFSCLNINNASSTFFFPGAGGDFSSIFNSFVTAMSFTTFRGWPNIFWAICDTQGVRMAFGVLVLVFSNALLVVNLFPAIFMSALKTGNIARRKIKWLALFPGNKRTISEFELMIWANANMDYINRTKIRRNTGGVLALFGGCCLWLIPCQSWKDQLLPKKAAAEEGDGIGSEKEEDDSDELVGLADARASTLDGESDDPLDAMESRTHEHMCVPRGRIFLKLRRIVFDDMSFFNQMIMVCIVLNIGFMAFDSVLFSDPVQEVATVSNIIFISIYLAEQTFKILVLGPFLYVDNPFNIFDLLLVLISLPSLVSSTGPFKVFNNFRILRMLRLARVVRIARLYRVVTNVYKHRDRSVHNMTITPGKLFGMILEFFMPMLNVVFLNLLVSFVFACLGMSFFGNMGTESNYPFDSTIEAIEVDSAPLQSLFRAWGAKYTGRMNFHNFINGFITVYNFGILNNWYHVMVNAIRLTSTGEFAFFFMLLFFLYYVPQSTLLASVVSLIEVTANQSLVALANDNEIVLRNVAFVNVRCHARLLIKKWQKNAMAADGGGAVAIHNENKQRRPEVKEATESAETGDYLTEFLVVHQEHSLYLFSEENYIRRFCAWVLNSGVYAAIYLAAIIISCIPSVLSTQNDYASETSITRINYILAIVFLVDFLFGLVAYGMVGKTGYFGSDTPLHYVDVVALALELGGFSDDTCQEIYLRVLLLRLMKVPALMQKVFRSLGGETTTVHAIESSIGSIVSVMIVSAVIGFFFAIIATQNFSTMYDYCSTDYYPQGGYRYGNYTDFPNGCSGNATVYDSILGKNITITNLHWASALDSFDDIFTAARSILRVMTFNEWQDIIYSGLDAVAVDYNPEPYHNRAAFIFFLMMGLVSSTMMFLGVAVIYYHYYIETAKTNRKIIFGGGQAFWANYEARLRVVQIKETPDPIMTMCRKNAALQVASIFYVIYPYALFFSQTSKFEDYKINLAVDLVFNIIFIVYAFTRAFRYRNTLSTYMNMTEFVIAVILLIFCLTHAGLTKSQSLGLCKVASILRTFILTVFFEQLSSFLKIIAGAITGFIPQVIFCIAVLLIFGTVGFSLFNGITIDYSNDYLNDHYNFSSFMKSLVTMLGMGTGNFWTEVIAGIKRNQSIGVGIGVDAFFTTYYILFSALFRSFPLLIVYRYLVEAGGSTDIATQQVIIVCSFVKGL
jgi:hypothetical protein